LLDPLAQFYLRAGWNVPAVEEIPGGAVPGAVAPVLVHDREMTLGLERYHETEVGIRVLARVCSEDVYARQVVLTRAADDTPLALAAVELRLDALPADARAAVRAEETPLGLILRGICPTIRRTHHGYFRFQPDAHVRRVLQSDVAEWVYGRRGVLTDAGPTPVATLIEVVAPLAPRRADTIPRVC